MADIDLKKKALKGIRCCRDMRNPPGYRFIGCDACPYEEKKHLGEKYYNCINRMLEDIEEILKGETGKMKWFDRLLEDWIIPICVVAGIVLLMLLCSGKI